MSTVEQVDLDALSPSEQFVYILSRREAARYWHNTDIDVGPVWDGIAVGSTVPYFFDNSC